MMWLVFQPPKTTKKYEICPNTRQTSTFYSWNTLNFRAIWVKVIRHKKNRWNPKIQKNPRLKPKFAVWCSGGIKMNLQVGGFIALILGVSFIDLVRILDHVQTKLVERLIGKSILNSMFQWIVKPECSRCYKFYYYPFASIWPGYG